MNREGASPDAPSADTLTLDFCLQNQEIPMLVISKVYTYLGTDFKGRCGRENSILISTTYQLCGPVRITRPL